MGLRFRRRVSIGGMVFNFGKRGLNSVTVGRNGANLNINENGIYSNTGINGTGLSYRQRLVSFNSSNSNNNQTNAGSNQTNDGLTVQQFRQLRRSRTNRAFIYAIIAGYIVIALTLLFGGGTETFRTVYFVSLPVVYYVGYMARRTRGAVNMISCGFWALVTLTVQIFTVGIVNIILNLGL